MSEQVFASEESLLREIHKTPSEYWPGLLQLIRVFRESVTLAPAAESFRKGWEEARRNETRPLSDLFDGIDAE